MYSAFVCFAKNKKKTVGETDPQGAYNLKIDTREKQMKDFISLSLSDLVQSDIGSRGFFKWFNVKL